MATERPAAQGVEGPIDPDTGIPFGLVKRARDEFKRLMRGQEMEPTPPTDTLPPEGHTYCGSPIPRPFQTTVEEAVRVLLRHVGQDPSSPGLLDTPKRVAKALTEMTAGYAEDPAEVLGRVFEDSYDEVVILRGIPFASTCEHHLLPFTGTADVGYIPGKVVGLSKLARLVDCFARRLQMQERMTRQIAEALMAHLGAKGAAVVTRGVHSCMQCRGVKKAGAEMVCSTMLGVFREEPETRAEFLNLCR